MNFKNLVYQSKWVLLSLLFVLAVNISFAQQEEEVIELTEEASQALADDDGKLPVSETWTTGVLIDNQTTEVPYAKTLEFIINHRFGKIKSIDDLFGIYAPSNIRLGLNYGITNKLSVGVGTEKNNKLQDFEAKYQIISQTRDGKIPVTVTYYANMAIDTRDKEFFGNNYQFTNRLSFFNQILVARKFTDALSVQVAASYSHFNAITDTYLDHTNRYVAKWKNDYIGVMLAGHYKFTPSAAFIFEYCQPFSLDEAWEGQNEPLSNLGLGIEFGTGTHAFQVFAAQYDAIVPQMNYARNLNDMGDGGWRLGFNIKVRF